MNELSFEGWKFFLKHALYYPSVWYFVYWTIPLLVMVGMIAYYRSRLIGETKVWARVGQYWKTIGVVLCGVVLVMYAVTVYSVPRLVFTPIDLKEPMLTVYHQSLVGEQNGDIVESLEKRYSNGEVNEVIAFFVDNYPYLHSLLFALLYFVIFSWFFILPGIQIERKSRSWSLVKVGK